MKKEERIEGNDNRFAMDYKQTVWTDSAKECKARGCECMGCNIVPQWFIERCKMKDCVHALDSEMTEDVDSRYNKEEMEKLYGQRGKTLDDVAKHYGVSRGTIRRVMRCLGIKLKTKGKKIKQC